MRRKVQLDTMPTTDFFVEHFAGPAMHDKLFALEASYNSPEVIKAFTKLKEWVTKGYFNEGFISLDPAQALPLLQQDKAAMIFQGLGLKTRTSSRRRKTLTITFPSLPLLTRSQRGSPVSRNRFGFGPRRNPKSFLIRA